MGIDYSPTREAPLSYYDIEFPGSGVRVDVHFSIVQALRNRTVAGDWGLLLGRRSISGGQWVLEALEPMAAGSAVGPSPVFERWKQGPQKRISAVGYYRKDGDFSGAIRNSDRLAVRQMFSQSALVLLVGDEGEPARLFRIGAAAEGEPESVTIEDRRLSPDEPAVAYPDQQIGAEAAFANFQAANGATTPPQIAAERPTLAVPSAPQMRHRPGVVIAAAVVLGVGVIAMPHGTSPAVSTRSTSLLGLRAQKQGNDLKVFWNREAPVIRDALSGTLVLQEQGHQQREIALDQRQIRSSTILYIPNSGEVKIQLTVSGTNGQASEAVIVNFRKGSPLQLHKTGHFERSFRGASTYE